MKNNTMFLDYNTQYYEDVNSSQNYLEIQCNFNHNPTRFFFSFVEIDMFLLNFMLKYKGPIIGNLEKEIKN